jgi:hypothetical protein
MYSRRIRRILAGVAQLAVVVSAASAQSSNLTATGHTGVAVPFGQFSQYATLGASAGIQVAYPIRDPLTIVVDAGVDNPQSDAPGLPDFRLWRYQAAVEADLVGASAESWGIRGLLGAGATTIRAGGYFPNLGSVPDELNRTYFTGSGGLALVFGASSPLHGYLGARLNWTRVDGDDFVALRSAALGAPPEPMDNLLTVPVTLGLRVRV